MDGTRRLLPLALVLANGLCAGCGLSKKMVGMNPPWSLGSATRTFVAPPYRVAYATFEAMRAELATVEAKDCALKLDQTQVTPDGRMPRPEEVHLPANHPGFWVEGLDKLTARKDPVLVTLQSLVIEGTTRDGRAVVANIVAREQGKETEVTIKVDPHGELSASRSVLDGVTFRLARPALAPGSPEERAALLAFFAPKAGEIKTVPGSNAPNPSASPR